MAKEKKGQKKAAVIGIILLIAIALLLGFFFMKKQLLISQYKTQHMATIYTGTLPCADCSSIHETLTLIPSIKNPAAGTYVMHDVYQGKDTKPFITTGAWQVAKDILTLNPNDPGMNVYFLIHEDGNLEMLDNDKKKIDSPFDETLYRMQ